MHYLELLRLASPEAVIVLTALAVLAVQFGAPRSQHLCFPVAIAGLVAAAAAVAYILPARESLYHDMIVVTPLTSLFKIVILILAFFTVLLASKSPFTSHKGEYLALILFATIGLMLLVSSEELLMIFIGLELTGLSLYILAAFDKSEILGIEAGLKYFLFGSTASAFTLFGLSLVYGMCHSTNLSEIGRNLAGMSSHPLEPLLIAGIAMTLVGFAFKVAAAPFHLWAPDAYEAAPLPSAAFIASGSKVASFFVLGKILLVGFGATGTAMIHQFQAGWAPLITLLAALSIVVGNIVALAQKNLRRLLAYSAVAHSGYTLLGLLATGREGYASTLFYTTIYAFTLIGAFGVAALVRRETGGDDIVNFTALSKRSPLLSACMGIFMLSLAGLPPLAGFFGKFYLFTAIIRAGAGHNGLWLVVLALAGSLVSLYYYLSVLKVIFMDQVVDTKPAAITLDSAQCFTVAALGALVLVLGLFPNLLVGLINQAIG